jgi:hypothetical protein
MFIEDTMRGPEDIMFALSFSPHVVKQLESNCSCCSSCHPSKYQESGSQWWHIRSILDILPQVKIKGRKVR